MSTSTAPTESDYWSPDRTHETQYRSPSLSPVPFCNVSHLLITIPSPIDQSGSPLCVLDHLQSLSVFISRDSTEVHKQLQQFLDRAPHLYALKISCGKLTSATMVPLQLSSCSVRSLDLKHYTQHEGWCWFTEQQCAVLSGSPLGARCEMLRINVENAMDAVNLVYSMRNLRAMNVQIKNDLYRPKRGYSSEADKDGLLDLLRGFFDPSCTIIRRDGDLSQIQLWIRWRPNEQVIYPVFWLVWTTKAPSREGKIKVIYSFTSVTSLAEHYHVLEGEDVTEAYDTKFTWKYTEEIYHAEMGERRKEIVNRCSVEVFLRLELSLLLLDFSILSYAIGNSERTGEQKI